MKKACSLILFLFTINCYSQKFDSLALEPPMGWNTWNKFTCNVNEELIRQAADALVASGMKDAGYTYIVIDDCWHGQRDSLGFIQGDQKKFPSGMKALADYIHSKGLKFGIYSCAGSKTCGGHPGSRGYEYQDAIMYAKWGVDYLKYDWCNTEGLKAEGAYMTMRDALYAAKRPIVFSLCEWGDNQPWAWGANTGHLWRTTGDIYHCWDCKKDNGGWYSLGVLQILDKQDGLRKYAGPGHWNDPDMMEVGNGMTENEDRAHFSMWCMLAAPLMAGNDLSNMSEKTKAILTNKEVIAIDQDPLGIQGFKYKTIDSVEIWFKPLEKGDWAVCFLNRKNVADGIEFDWKENSVTDSLFHKEVNFKAVTYKIRNLWLKKGQGTTGKIFKTTLDAHDVVMLRLSRQ
ncbi:MAG: glycoside hydrolase family 27 protein [Cytophagaceae bacterium]|nr:glycoside hydrolase family 27 protein [Cytophagaceae bacterium]